MNQILIVESTYHDATIDTGKASMYNAPDTQKPAVMSEIKVDLF